MAAVLRGRAGMVAAVVLLSAGLSGCIFPRKSVCVGEIAPVDGVHRIGYRDDDLLRSALGGPGEGRLCNGTVFVVEKPVTVYRVWDSNRKYSEMGRWWTFDPPQGPAAGWREKHGVCPELLGYDMVTKCRLKPLSRIVVGTVQSVDCLKDKKEITIPPSAANQIFVANKLGGNEVYVESCEEGVAWPDAEGRR